MKYIWIPKDERVIPPWIKGGRPWVVVAKIEDKEKDNDKSN